MDYPLGVGLGLYGYFLNKYSNSEFAADRLDFYPNNDPAMFLAYGGLIFLAGYLWAFGFILNRSKSFWLTVAIVALLLQSLSGYIFFNPPAMLIFSLVLAGANPILKSTRVRIDSIQQHTSVIVARDCGDVTGHLNVVDRC